MRRGKSIIVGGRAYHSLGWFLAVTVIITAISIFVHWVLRNIPRPQPVRVVVVEKPVAIAVQPSQPPVYPTQKPSYPNRGQFQQVGVLVAKGDMGEQPTLLALFGRKMSHRDRWEYYIASDKFHMSRLPIMFKNRMCDEDVGCEEIYQGDEVTVPDYGNQTFTARIYKYEAPSW
jgi:hypothetical protein